MSSTCRYHAGKEKTLGDDVMRKVEREVYLQVLDTLWMQHLENMQHLREGIHWRSIGQRDPLVEYRGESQLLFDGLQATLRDEVVRAVMHVEKTDVLARVEEEHDTVLTRLAEKSVEQGVNEIGSGESNRDDDFNVKKAKTVTEVARQKTRFVRRKKPNDKIVKKTVNKGLAEGRAHAAYCN